VFGLGGNSPEPGIVVIGLGCTPLGILLSLLLSAFLTLLANLFLRRRR
jgi:hypothetical protein